jgi:DNA-binding NarL/FixJ family response regulator
VNEDNIRANAKKNGLLCQLLATAIDSVITMKFPRFYLAHEGSPAVKICPKPLLLLTQMARTGLNVKRAALALNMSEDTVNKHIRAAKDALGAKTTAHAVYLAIQRGLICCDE